MVWYYGTLAVVAAVLLLALAPMMLKLLPSVRLREDWQIVALPDGVSIRVAKWVKWIDLYAICSSSVIYVTPRLIAAPELVWRQVIRYETSLLLRREQWKMGYLVVSLLLGLWARLCRCEHPWKVEAREYAGQFLVIDAFISGQWPR